MKLFHKALLVLALGSSFNGAYAGQAPQAAPIITWESWWMNSSKFLNPCWWAFKYGEAATSVSTGLIKATKEAITKKEFTPRLTSSIFRSLGFAALTISPWVVYRIWFKDFYNNQMRIYTSIREIVKKHYDTYVLNIVPCNACFKQNQLLYATEKAFVLGHAQALRRVSRLYMAQDSHLIKLLKSFYINLESGKPCYNQFIAIQNHCMGILP